MRNRPFYRGNGCVLRGSSWQFEAIVLTCLLSLSVGGARGEQVNSSPKPESPSAQSRTPTEEGAGTALATPTPNTITGYIFDPSGNPVDGAPVQAKILDPYGSSRPLVKTGVSNADGWFQIETQIPPKGTWHVSVDAPAYAREWERERTVTTPVAVNDLPLQIHLQAPQSLHGVVVDELDQPVGGVRVILNQEWLGENQEPLQPRDDFKVGETLSEPDGSFEFSRLRPGRVGLILQHKDFAVTRVQPLTSDGTHRLTILKGFTVEGTITADGKPLAGMTLCVKPGEGKYGQMLAATADEHGTFRIEHVSDVRTVGRPDDPLLAIWVYSRGTDWASGRYEVYLDKAGKPPIVNIEAFPRSKLEGGSGRPEIVVGR